MFALPDTRELPMLSVTLLLGLETRAERPASHCNAPNPTQPFGYRKHLRALGQGSSALSRGPFPHRWGPNPLHCKFGKHPSLGLLFGSLFSTSTCCRDCSYGGDLRPPRTAGNRSLVISRARESVTAHVLRGACCQGQGALRHTHAAVST